MEELNQFEIQLKSGASIKGEYEGNLAEKKVLIFSHGFGVTRDSRGMFTEIGDMLKENYLIIRFDYNHIDKENNSTTVYPYSTQADILKAIHKYALNEFSPNSVSIISHSMGCLITSIAELPNIEKAILIAGPPTPPYTGVKDYFSKRKDTNINEEGISTIKRSDGSITYVPKEFWSEMKSTIPEKVYSNLAKQTKVIYIRALSDQIITDTNYSGISNNQNINYHEIDGDHDFDGDSRVELKEFLRVLL